ncbi:sensor domain-containing protein [Mycobacterium sp. Marseille-P9652]|uniref:sensor domain-containing protein n=1 Tax=Mycobacterium sp. Marseille-P9652 TaxID=2654950 RepID=UPI001E2EDA3C|nr:sensor domain-containing diguanylate cyclase [Mycobacterium sp. Marseille-P9652]
MTTATSGSHGRRPGPTPTDGVDSDSTSKVLEQRYRRLVDHSPDAICVHSAGRIVYVNAAAVRWMAAESANQLVGHPITDFVHPDSIAPMLTRIGSLSREGDATEPAEALMQRFDGTTLAVESVSVLTVWEDQPAYQVIFRDLTGQKMAEATLRYQAALVNHVADAVIATTADGTVTSWNPAAEAIYRRPATDALGLPVSHAVGAPVDPAAILAGGGVLHATHHDSLGAALTVRVSAAIMDEGYVLLCCDQTALRRAEQYFQTVVSSLEQGVMVIDHDGHLELLNPAARRIIGLPSTASDPDIPLDTLAAIPFYDSAGVRLPDSAKTFWEAVTDGAGSGTTYGIDRVDDGRRVWVSLNLSLLAPYDPARSALLVSFTDVTEQHNARQRLMHEAAHDALTGLPNRTQAMRRIAEALTDDAHRRLAALLFIDLDNMKLVNDSLGHAAGDEMIRIAAQRLREEMRMGDLIARYAGDEFVALIVGDTGRSELEALSARIHQALHTPVVISGTTWFISASIGVVVILELEHCSPGELLRYADQAMYRAKAAGGGTTAYSSFPRGKPRASVVHRSDEAGSSIQ